MAPTISLGDVAKRYYTNCDYYGNCYYTAWDRWGRWVALVCIVASVIFLALVFSCINSRRRRRRGVQPMYGTGWMAGKTPEGHNAPAYYNQGGYSGYNNGYNQDPPVPAYAPPINQHQTGHTYNSNDGYYGQQSGIELQQPQHVYAPQRGGEPVYDAPSGPPPKKH